MDLIVFSGQSNMQGQTESLPSPARVRGAGAAIYGRRMRLQPVFPEVSVRFRFGYKMGSYRTPCAVVFFLHTV